MSEEILINVTPMETRVAVIENGVVQEIIIERTAKRGLVGGIFKGKVVRVLPGMQAAFVDIGLERAAFLHAKDIWVPGDGSDNEDSPTIFPSDPTPIPLCAGMNYPVRESLTSMNRRLHT